MSYDQAQSPRLGQRTPVESTYVQIFDVDPDTPTADLIEAAWPGMLVFRKDLEILQIFDGETGAWKDVAGGVAGHLTYVGTEPPTGTNVKPGDTWVDSDDGFKQYTWTGAEWVLAITADMVGPGTFPGPITARFRVGSPIGPNGERVDLDENGLRVFTADPTAVPPGKVGTILGSNGLQVFKGEAEVQNLTTTESATFREEVEYARSSRTKLSAGVSAPGSKPIPSLDWAQVPLSGHDFALTRPISGMRWVVHTDPVLREASISKWEVPVTGSGVSRMLEFNADGSFSAQLGADRTYAGAGADIGGVRANEENYWLSSPGAGDVLLVGPTNSYDFTPLGKGGSKVLGYDGSRLLVVENYLSGATAKARVTKFFPSAAQGSTVVPNGTFDTNITGWSAYSEVAISRTTVSGEYASGTGGLKLTGASPTNAIAVARSSIGTSGFPIVGNRSYRLTAEARNSGPVGNSVTFTLKYYTSAGTFISGQGFNKSSSGGAFQTWTVNTVAPPTAAYGSVEIMVGSLNINSHVYVDNVQVYSQAGLNYDTAFDLTLTGANDPLRALYAGSADFGEQVYALARAGAGNEVLVVPDDTKVSDPTLSFPQPSTSVRSLGYNGDFWTLDENKVLHQHESGNGFTTQPSRWWASCTYQIPGTAETLMGPAQDFTMSRRARLTLSVPAILETEDTDPTHVGVYLGRDPAPVDRLDMHYQGNTDTGSKVITSADFTAANPPDTPGVFGDATPAELYADSGGFVLKGDSTGDWPEIRMTVQEEGEDAVTAVKKLDFRGSGVYVGPGVNPGDAVVTVTGGSGEEGTAQVGAAMYRTTAHSVAHNTTTQMNFGTVAYANPPGIASTSTDHITVSEDGTYYCEAYVQWDSGNNNAGLRTINIEIDDVAWHYHRTPTQATDHATFNYIAFAKELVAGTSISANLIHTQGASLATSASADGHTYWMSVHKIDGVKGDPGPPGLTGATGATGAAGAAGATGAQGSRWGNTNAWLVSPTLANCQVSFGDGGPPRIGDLVTTNNGYAPGDVYRVTAVVDATHADLAHTDPHLNIRGPAGTSPTLAVQDENATVVASATQLDFQGSYVTATAGAAGEAIITIGPPPASYSSAILADSPLAYWRFGETTSTYADSSGNGRVLTDFGAGGNRGVTGLISGDTDKAFESNSLSFSKHAYRAYETWMNPAALTYELLCKPTTRASAREHYSVMSRGMESATPFFFRFSQVSGDTYQAVVSWYAAGVAKSIVGGSFNITAAPIIHLAFTHDGSTGRLYVNGTEVGNAASGAVQGGGTWLVYGAWNQANYTYPYQGTIDEGAIYGTALSASKIASHVAGLTVPGPDSYTFTQGSAAATWVINHPMSYRPNIIVVDSTGRQVEGDVVYTDADTITVNFSGAFAGAAYLS